METKCNEAAENQIHYSTVSRRYMSSSGTEQDPSLPEVACKKILVKLLEFIYYHKEEVYMKMDQILGPAYFQWNIEELHC